MIHITPDHERRLPENQALLVSKWPGADNGNMRYDSNTEGETGLDTIVGLFAGVAIVLILLGIARRERYYKNRGVMMTKRPSTLFPLAFIILALCGLYWSYAAAISEHYIEAISLLIISIIVLPKNIRGLFPRT